MQGGAAAGSVTGPAVLAADGPVAVVRELGSLVVHAAAEDVRINKENAALYGVLDTSFRGLSLDEELTDPGGDEWVNEWPRTPPGTL